MQTLKILPIQNLGDNLIPCSQSNQWPCTVLCSVSRAVDKNLLEAWIALGLYCPKWWRQQNSA